MPTIKIATEIAVIHVPEPTLGVLKYVESNKEWRPSDKA